MIFENKAFVSHAGVELLFKIECDALGDDDLETLANVVLRKLVFGSVVGIPRGGIRFARVLEKCCVPGAPPLIVDDVYTTGKSMEEARKEGAIGVVIFARGECPEWIYPIFQLSEWARP
jgi:hypothetical protein